LSPGDGSDIRRRAETAASRFVDAHDWDDARIAKAMREWEIDIAIDLNGLTGAKRHGILALRPAPIQVNYLGYPGTMAAPFIDYIIADPVIIPKHNRIHYSEKIAYLPNAYLPWDRKHQLDEDVPSRSDQGLPENGFVFSCFNNLYKLSPEIFDIWMRILNEIEGSVLWLGSSGAAAKNNVLRAASLHGIAPERVIFARYMDRVEAHLARQRLADLFLDTLPYCAHSTGSDALWAGLPLLTRMGDTFAGRVAASLLSVSGLPELVTNSAEEYEAKAVELARSPDRLAAVREKLRRNQSSTPLFDTALFTRDLETVYRAMWRRHLSGLPPEDIAPATSR
jgi:protein O-GlcNAc transferase